MLEILDGSNYLFCPEKDRGNLQISKYKSCFRKGILLNHKLLYFLLKGSYWEEGEETGERRENFSFSPEEKLNYQSLKILLNRIKGDVGEYTIFITPHIFTKFINELRKGVRNEQHFSNILTIFIENFTYIKEEELKKEEIINFAHFKNRYCGLSETALILLKEKFKDVCIIDDSSNKIPKFGGENYLFIDFPTIKTIVNEYKRREEL